MRPAQITVVVAWTVASAAWGQTAPTNLAGQYDPGTTDLGLLRLCPVGEPGPDCNEVPFTPQGEAAARAFDRRAYQEAYAASCTVPQMPDVTTTGRYLLRLYQGEDLVRIIYQRTDTVRTVSLDGEAPPADFPPTRLGYSVGRWDGEALIVETTHVIGGSVGNTGLPYSDQSRITERYWHEPGSRDLNMEVTLEDPVNYTRAFMLSKRRFAWRPELEWTPWNCTLL